MHVFLRRSQKYFLTLFFILISTASYAFQLGYFYPERKAEVLQKGDSVLELRERQRPAFLNLKDYPKMPIGRLMAEFHLHNAGKYIDKNLFDSAFYHAEKAVGLSETMDDEELKLVALVTAGKLMYQKKEHGAALVYYNLAEDLKAPKHQQIYRQFNLKNVLKKSQKQKDAYVIEQYHKMLALAEGMETEALRLWYVYIAQGLASTHRGRNELGLASNWFQKAANAAEKLPPDSYEVKTRLGMVQSGFLFRVKRFEEALNVLIKLDDVFKQGDVVKDRAIYWRRWYNLLRYAPDSFLKTNAERLLYSPEIIEGFFRDESIAMTTNHRINGLQAIINRHSRKENWKYVSEIYAELRELEGKKQLDELKDGFNKRNELLQASADAQEALRLEQLQKAKADQRLFLAGILLVLTIGFFIYRTSILRKRQNNALNEKNQLILQQKQDLEQINELKSKFFTNISHELRTPLTLAQGNIKNALKGKYGPLNDRQSKSLTIANANSNRILGLVQDMLDLSKIESGKEKINARAVELENECHAVLNLFDVQLEEKGLAVEVNTETPLEAIYLDPLKVETILFNLFSNAIKHSYKESTLTVRLWEEENQQKVSISNQGDGIPEQDLPYVFDRFFQAGSTKSGEGSGVGLSLTKELVELHQGEISVKSSLNELTHFTLSFLKGTDHYTEDQVLKELDENVDSVSTQSGAKVLVVEDNADMRHYLYELLSEQFKVSLAENGQDALNRIESIQPDLVITDYMMPEMNGVKFFRGMRQLEGLADVPVVFLTARAIERDRESLLKEGVDDYILKPFSDADLFRRIGQLLSLKGERKRHRNTSTGRVEELESKFLNQLRATVFASIEDNMLSPTVLAEVLSVSERTLYRKVKASTGFSPQAYIKEIRLQEAQRLIEDGVYESISDVAYAVGFEHLSHFSASYKERFGVVASAHTKQAEA